MTKARATIGILVDLVLGYIKKHYFFFAIGLVAGLLLVYLGKDIKEKNKDTIGVVGNYTVSTLPLAIQEKLSYGLTKLNERGEATSGASLTFTSTGSGKIINFTIASDLYWHDGTKFKVEDINYNLKGVTIEKSDRKVSFQLKEPFAPLPIILSQPLFKNGLVKSYSFLPDSLNRALFSSGLIGLGNYKLITLSFIGRFISNLELENIQDGSKISYKFYPSEETALTALKLGQVNSVAGIFSPQEFTSNRYYQIQNRTLSYTEAILFYNLESPFLAEKNFRQGLTYALSDTFTQGARSESPFPPNSWARSVLVKKYPQNFALARDLVSKFASVSADKKIKLKITTLPVLKPTAAEIAKNWQKVGVEVEVETVDLLPSRYQIYLGLVELPIDPDQYSLWHSTQSTNISRYKSFKIDKLLEEGRKTLDKKERQQKYSDFQKAITEDVPAAFLFYPTVYDIKRKY